MSQTLASKRKTSFMGDVTRLMSGTVLAQVLGVIITPVLTRMYAPEDFGMLASFTSIVSVLGYLSCMRYEMSIVLPDNDPEAANLLGVSLGFTLLITILTALVAVFEGKEILLLLKLPTLEAYLWVMPIAVCSLGVFQALNYWNTRTKHFMRLSIAQVNRAAFTCGGKLAGGFWGHAKGDFLVGSYVGGQVIATLVLGAQIFRDDGRVLWRNIHLRGMLSGITRHKNFPIYGISSALLDQLAIQLPVLMLGYFFSSIIVGYYSLGYAILALPMALVGRAISMVFLQKAAEAKYHGNLGNIIEDTFTRLVTVGIFPMIVLSVIGKDLFSVFFGSKWAEAGVYTQILSISAALSFITSPLSHLTTVLEKQWALAVWDLGFLTLSFVSLWTGCHFNSIYVALILYSLSTLFINWILLVVLFRWVGMRVSSALYILLRNLLVSSIFVSPIIAVSLLFGKPLLTFSFSGLSGIAYILYNYKSLGLPRINLPFLK